MGIAAADRRMVRDRARGRSEYCRMAEQWEPFFSYHVEHIIAVQHGGPDTVANLALACNHCNFIKGPNLTSIDPDTGKVTVLFHPRTDNWDEHFCRVGDQISGLTDIGRTTVFLLQMNAPHRAELRWENSDAW
jgi:hypothetical protein